VYRRTILAAYRGPPAPLRTADPSIGDAILGRAAKAARLPGSIRIHAANVDAVEAREMVGLSGWGGRPCNGKPRDRRSAGRVGGGPDDRRLVRTCPHRVENQVPIDTMLEPLRLNPHPLVEFAAMRTFGT